VKILNGQWLVWTDGNGSVAYKADYDLEDHRAQRVIVREVGPVMRIKPSEALAWLMTQTGWELLGDASGWCAQIGCGQPYGAGATPTKAIIALRKAMGVKV
jgi:hypothetical protein